MYPYLYICIINTYIDAPFIFVDPLLAQIIGDAGFRPEVSGRIGVVDRQRVEQYQLQVIGMTPVHDAVRLDPPR